MLMTETKEFTSYIAPDGIEHQFHIPSGYGRWILSESGWGTPPIDYITQRGPFQHGETVRDFFLRPRVIQMLIRQQFCNRDDWWGGRGLLLNAIRPNRQTTPTASEPGQLRRIESDGTIRDLNVFISQGPRFEPRERARWDEWAFQEVLRFTAYDPVVFDPTEVEVILGLETLLNLVFPITFPIVFGASRINDTVDLIYPGTWETFPIIVITGPMNNFRIVNNSTLEAIELTYNIALGDSITIDLSYGAKTVIDSDGVNRIGTVTPESDLATFRIAPGVGDSVHFPIDFPAIFGGGINSLTVTGSGALPGTTQVAVRYFSRYFGI